MAFEYPEGATSLEPEEIEGLKDDSISTRSELDEMEGLNILAAYDWLGRKNTKDILTESFLCRLHKQMFGGVWRWAGSYRSTEKNIGCRFYLIPTQLKELLENTKFMIGNEEVSNEEVLVRFHHGLVKIHPFPNGNGRHSRLACDLLANQLGIEEFTWGKSADNLTSDSNIRRTYIAALKAADRGDITQLTNFVRT
jgi:Fic-DOC domain mobile mystery protein B